MFAEQIEECVERRGSVFICGNGGSAANAIHIANDFTYAYQNANAKVSIEALCSNPAVLTCLANDLGYDFIYSYQLETKLNKDDLLIALSGSGNSQNIINALQSAKVFGCKTFGIFGFDGGKAKSIADNAIVLNANDMQASEDLQVVIAHAALRHLISQL